ncbi:hypothetical protein BX616_006364 [Lobosporangium transversale]|nr:hypothetical protein BX616_006364 [Lobosporangium transversale]
MTLYARRARQLFIIVMALHPSFLTGIALSKCCYSISSHALDPLDSSSSSSYAVTLKISAHSTNHGSSPEGVEHKAIIKFPDAFLITATPSGCMFVSSSTAFCQWGSQDQLQVSFPNITALPDGVTLQNVGNGGVNKYLSKRVDEGINGNTITAAAATPSAIDPPHAESVSVNGETRAPAIKIKKSEGSHSRYALNQVNNNNGSTSTGFTITDPNASHHDVYRSSDVYISYREKSLRHGPSFHESQDPRTDKVAAEALPRTGAAMAHRSSTKTARSTASGLRKPCIAFQGNGGADLPPPDVAVSDELHLDDYYYYDSDDGVDGVDKTTNWGEGTVLQHPLARQEAKSPRYPTLSSPRSMIISAPILTSPSVSGGYRGSSIGTFEKNNNGASGAQLHLDDSAGHHHSSLLPIPQVQEEIRLRSAPISIPPVIRSPYLLPRVLTRPQTRRDHVDQQKARYDDNSHKNSNTHEDGGPNGLYGYL